MIGNNLFQFDDVVVCMNLCKHINNFIKNPYCLISQHGPQNKLSIIMNTRETAAKMGFAKGVSHSSTSESGLTTTATSTVSVSKIPVPLPTSSPSYNPMIPSDKRKLRGACPKCNGEFRLQSDGKLYKHGHRDNPCIGSSTTPSIGSIVQSQSAPMSNNLATSQSQPSTNRIIQNSIINNDYDDADILKHPMQTNAVIKHIPKSARRTCSTLLAKLLQDVADNIGSVRKWRALLSFAPIILCKPNRGGKKRNIAAIIVKRVNTFPNSVESIGPMKRLDRRPFSSDEIRAKAAIAKIEDGNLQAAVRILSSDDQPAEDNEDTLRDLAEKHPSAPIDSEFLNDSVTTDIEPLQVSERDVQNSISSFPSGSSAGLDSLTPQHIKDMTGTDGDPTLLSNLTNLVNILLHGSLPEKIAKIIYGGKLIALRKKDGGIRPITVGHVIRRIVAKCANHSVINNISQTLLPRQLGVGVKGGLEAAVHTTRRYFELNKDDNSKIAVKLDFKNAFNSVRRDTALAIIAKVAPSIYNFCKNVGILHPTRSQFPQQ